MPANTRLHVKYVTIIAIHCNSLCTNCQLSTGLVDHIGVLQTPMKVTIRKSNKYISIYKKVATFPNFFPVFWVIFPNFFSMFKIPRLTGKTTLPFSQVPFDVGTMAFYWQIYAFRNLAQTYKLFCGPTGASFLFLHCMPFPLMVTPERMVV